MCGEISAYLACLKILQSCWWGGLATRGRPKVPEESPPFLEERSVGELFLDAWSRQTLEALLMLVFGVIIDAIGVLGTGLG